MFAQALLRRDTGIPVETVQEPLIGGQTQPTATLHLAYPPNPLFKSSVELATRPNAAQQALWDKAETILEAQRKWLAGFNKSMTNGCAVVAFPLIPPGIWRREQGEFLMQAFDFFPASLGNTVLATLDNVSARVLNLPPAPRIPNRLLEDSTHHRLTQMRQRFATEHENMALAFSRGDFTGLGNSVGRKARYGRELTEMAASIGFATFGKQAWLAHERLFSTVLGQRKI